jgi:DNA-binding Lrp family transcriptional regulator
LTKMKLNSKDWKIIEALERNFRSTLPEISAHANISKQVAGYRLARLLRSKIIDAQIQVNLSHLRKFHFTLLVKLATTEKTESILESLEALENVNRLMFCDGPFDIIIDLVTPTENQSEGYDLLLEILNKFRDDISNYEFLLPVSSDNFNRKWVGKSSELARVTGHQLGFAGEKPRIDATDEKIVSCLFRDARAPLVDIAKSARINVKTCHKRLMQLVKQKTVFGSLSLDYEKLGMGFYVLEIGLRNAKPAEMRRLESYLKEHRNVTYMTKFLGPWQIEIGLEVENEKQYYDFLYNLRKVFGHELKNFSTLKVLRQLKSGRGNLLSI